MGVIKRAWKGEEKLWKVFWLYGVCGYITLNVVYEIIKYLGKLYTSFTEEYLIVAFVQLAYVAIIFVVCCWRCAFNVRVKFWGYLARIFSILGVLYILIVLSMTAVSYVLADKLKEETGFDLLDVGNKLKGGFTCAQEEAHHVLESGLDIKEYEKLHPTELNDCFKAKTGESLKKDPVSTDPHMAPPPLPLGTEIPAEINGNIDSVMRANRTCSQIMEKQAIKNGVDVRSYYEFNRPYFRDCMQQLSNSPQAHVVP